MLCNYGCGQEAIKQFKNGKVCCSENFRSCPKMRRNLSEKLTGRTKENNEGRRIQAEKITGRTKENNEGRRKQAEQMSEKMTGRTKENNEGVRRMAEKKSEWMKVNGNRIRKLIKNPSNLELKLRTIVKELYPISEHTYSILNYDVDIALPEFKIVIEYDGWYHFDTEEHREYHKKRQEEIEQEGWKFLRYNCFQKFPSLDQVKRNILELLSCHQNVTGCDGLPDPTAVL
jgi:hypothetical protein